MRKRVKLTARDHALFEEIGRAGALTIEHIARLLFAKNAASGALNTAPEEACERRVRALCSAGFLSRVTAEDGSVVPGAFGDRPVRRALISLGARARALLEKAKTHAGRTFSESKIVHHVRTLDALAVAERELAARGLVVVRRMLEGELRGEAQRGRFLRSGDSFDPFPDAVLFFARTNAGIAVGRSTRSASGIAGSNIVRVAVEYATSKYTDADIQKKHDGFASYDVVLWFADRESTKARVERITGGSCSILR